MIFRIDTTDVIKYELDDSWLGKWSYLIGGIIQGFFDTPGEAEDSYGHVVG